MSDAERTVAAALAELMDGNPFQPAWRDAERRALGRAFVERGPIWHATSGTAETDPNLARLGGFADALARRLRERIASGARPEPGDVGRYRAVATWALYHRFEPEWWSLIVRAERGERGTVRATGYPSFAAAVGELLDLRGDLDDGFRDEDRIASPAQLFAWGFQVRRAFHQTFRQIYGGSAPAARLRAAVWESIFTHDPARYRRALVERMGDVPTLVVGESGTGKELVARAIGLARWVPFEERTQAFAEDFTASFRAVNLSALSPTLIESELFGHRRGSFTGALADRAGWLEECGPRGTVFLDEIGELDAGIQVKLLRVFQTRSFERIGESQPRRFTGKIVAATNRDLAVEIDAGRFREDFYYRIAADVVATPTLREQLADAPGDLRHLALVLARRIAGDDEAERLAEDVERFVVEHLGIDYAWPGNVRELEQCVRSVLVHGHYRPAPRRLTRAPLGAGPRPAGGCADDGVERASAMVEEALGPLPRDGRDADARAIVAAIESASMNAEELLARYCRIAHARWGSYQEAARRIGLDRRTVKAKAIPRA